MKGRHRRSSRVLVLDENDRVLMFLTAGSVPAQATRWITPGGGVDPGENHHDAACRELFEETGMVIDDLGDPIWSYDFDVDYVGGDHDTGHAEYYLLRAAAFIPSSLNWTESEHIDVLEHRWWSLDQLQRTAELYDPAPLPELVARFVAPSSHPEKESIAMDDTASNGIAADDTGSNDTLADGTASIIAEIEQQERELVFSRFTNNDALKLGSILVDLARSRDLAVTVDITRGEQQLFHAALAGTAAHNDVWITRKTRTVRELGVSSYLAGVRARASGNSFEDAPWIDPLRYSGHGGSFPVTVDGVGVIGTVTVSGLPQRDDHALAVDAIRSFLSVHRPSA